MVDYLSDEFYKQMKREVKTRVNEKRYNHILGVAKTCEKIANAYGLNVKKARLAGILHDWDKGLSVEDEIAKAHSFNLQEDIDECVIQNLPHLLHGPTAAKDFLANYEGFPEDVAHAIYVHTTACVDMSDLDMCLYIADAIEPSRHYDELESLQDMVGKSSLKELYEAVFVLWTAKLILNRKFVEPNTINVYNEIILRSKKKPS